MLKLYENEKVIIAFHRHWIVVANKTAIAAALLLIPVIALIVLPSIDISFGSRIFVLYLIAIYTLVVIMAAFALWIDYYLDLWIVTDARIIDVEQKGMFKREVSEFLLSSIQDITVETTGIFGTLFNYGTIKIHTAGEQAFVAQNIPKADEIKNAILAEVKKAGARRMF